MDDYIFIFIVMLYVSTYINNTFPKKIQALREDRHLIYNTRVTDPVIIVFWLILSISFYISSGFSIGTIIVSAATVFMFVLTFIEKVILKGKEVRNHTYYFQYVLENTKKLFTKYEQQYKNIKIFYTASGKPTKMWVRNCIKEHADKIALEVNGNEEAYKDFDSESRDSKLKWMPIINTISQVFFYLAMSLYVIATFVIEFLVIID